MKTKEGILIDEVGELPIERNAQACVFWNDAILAMQTYADQQCAEKDKAIAALREEILSVHESAEKWRSQRDNLLLESRDLRRRLDDCERKRITGQRL